MSWFIWLVCDIFNARNGTFKCCNKRIIRHHLYISCSTTPGLPSPSFQWCQYSVHGTTHCSYHSHYQWEKQIVWACLHPYAVTEWLKQHNCELTSWSSWCPVSGRYSKEERFPPPCYWFQALVHGQCQTFHCPKKHSKTCITNHITTYGITQSTSNNWLLSCRTFFSTLERSKSLQGLLLTFLLLQ